MPEQTDTDLATRESLSLGVGRGLVVHGLRAKIKKIRFIFYDVIKRFLDFILATVMLVMLSPILVLIAIVVRIDSSGPVLFRQERVGRNGRLFKILKFRSMTVDNDVRDSSCEDQYTRIGGVLRRTSLDELPQLFNVLMGQMSFIGPRPWIPDYWTNMSAEERIRGRVRPGITGLAAAKGRNGLTVFQKIAYDLEYVRNYSLKQDIKVILMTARTVLKKEVAEAGKGGIHNDIEDLKAESTGPRVRIVVKTDPLVSVVVPLGNGEDYICEIVSTALGRNCGRMELMLMNDNCTDQVKKMLDGFAPGKIRVVNNGAEINEMPIEAEGRFMCYTDVNATWRPERVG